MKGATPSTPDESVAIHAHGLGKRYRLWKDATARLKHPLLDRAHRSVRSLLGDDAAALGPLARWRAEQGDNFDALRDVSFTIQRGESVAIIGRNGSGKSTLLQILAGTLQATSGEVEVQGRVAALLELGSGFHPEFTGRENVYLNAAIHGLAPQEIDERYAEIERFAEIGPFMEQPVKTYSSGMVVRLAFAVLTQMEPDILVIDEALSVGDFLFQQKCFDRIRAFRERGTTCLFVSHDLSTVLDLCPRSLLLQKGQLIYDGPTKEAADLYQAAALQERYANTGLALQIRGPGPTEAEPEPMAPPTAEEAAEFAEAEEALLAAPEMTEPEVGSITTDRVQLRSVEIFGADGKRRDWVTSEEEITLAIGILCRVPLDDPHVGFKIRDGLARVMFETSTLCMRRPVREVAAGELLVSRFRFALPLHAGQYSVTVGVANGAVGQSDYREALLFQHGVKVFDVVRNPAAIIWSGIFNLQPEVTFSRQRVEARQDAEAPV